MFVIAMPSEIDLIDKNKDYIITGVGALNVIKSLINVDRSTHITNVGYAGSNNIPVGTKVNVGKVKLYHPNVNYEEQDFQLCGNIPCYTSNDFVLSTEIKEPCVFDMELAYILALGFKDVTSIKIVSDNLSLKEFEKCLKK